MSREPSSKKFVKVSGGMLKGRKIYTPGGDTHPMGERERIALFNILGDRVLGNFVMDLYCGGGTLLIEALSRGARFGIGIDISHDATKVADDNLKRLDLYGVGFGCGATMQGDITKIARTATDRYGIVIADPPYDKFSEKMVKYLPRLVLDGGILVLSHPTDEPPKLKGINLVDTRKYAGAHLSFYVKD